MSSERIRCESILGILPSYTERRKYIPKSAKPYLCRVEGDEPLTSTVFRLVVPDGKEGTHISFGEQNKYTEKREDELKNRECNFAWLSSADPIPSKSRITCLLSPVGNATENTIFVSDVHGNVFTFNTNESMESPLKRGRREQSEEPFAASTAAVMSGEWRPIVGAKSPNIASLHGTSADAMSPMFQASFDMEGWSGLAHTARGLVSGRQFYSDIRLLDAEKGEVVHTYGTSHCPTGVVGLDTGASPFASCVLVAEGPLATIYDVRSAGAAFSPKEVFTISEQSNEQISELQKRVQAQGTVPTVPGRLTSNAGTVRDVCALYAGASSRRSPFEVALAIDRALCVYDIRKFTKQFTQSNVLKYTISSICPTAGGEAVVCSGIDSEVRVVSLRPSAETTEEKRGPEKDGDDPLNSAAKAPVSTFRTRLDDSTSCETAWCGGWAASEGFRNAVGISMDNEVFIA